MRLLVRGADMGSIYWFRGRGNGGGGDKNGDVFVKINPALKRRALGIEREISLCAVAKHVLRSKINPAF